MAAMQSAIAISPVADQRGVRARGARPMAEIHCRRLVAVCCKSGTIVKTRQPGNSRIRDGHRA
jgi:hypothetical protein